MASEKRSTAPKPYRGTDGLFLASCEKAKVAPTNRQFRRFNQGRGQAFAVAHQISQEEITFAAQLAAGK